MMVGVQFLERRPVAQEQLDHRCLAGPIWTQQTVNLARFNLERQPVHGTHLAKILDEAERADHRSAAYQSKPEDLLRRSVPRRPRHPAARVRPRVAPVQTAQR